MRMSPRGSESATARAFRRCGVQGQMTRGDIDRDQPVGNVVTLRELINDKLEARRWNTLVITLFGVLAIFTNQGRSVWACILFHDLSFCRDRRTYGSRRMSI